MLYLKRHHAEICENKTSVSWLYWSLEQILLKVLALTASLGAYELFLMVIIHAFGIYKFILFSKL